MIDTTHENSIKIEKWFHLNNLDMQLDDDTICKLYRDVCYKGDIVNSLSLTERIRVMKIQISFIRKNVLGLIYKNNNNSSKGIKQGYVYAISNPAWDNYIKIGSSIDVYDRLSSYQTSSPHRDYELIGYVYSEDRYKLESNLHSKFPDRKSEWVKIDKSSVKSYLKSFEHFPEQAIVNFCASEALRTISDYYSTNNSSERESVKQFYKTVKHKMKSNFSWMNDADVESAKSIKKIGNTWYNSDMKVYVEVHKSKIVRAFM